MAFLIAVLCAFGSFCYGQTTVPWKIRPVKLKTRWAKDVRPDNVLPEYPRPQMVRSKWINLNGLWNYEITDKNSGRPEKYNKTILVPYPIESALSGVKKELLPSQKLWYKRTFIQKTEKGNKLLVHFGAVDWEASVYVNGKEIGVHKGGYQNFSFDITDALKDGENELIVGVYDPTDQGINPHGKQVLNPQNIYYTANSGIWQTVWLESVPYTYIDNLILTPNIDSSHLQILVNTNKNLKDFTVEAVSNKGSSVKGKPGKLMLLPVRQPHLWSPDDPYLYGLTVKLLYKGKIIDTVSSYFGMRKIEVKKDDEGIERLFLNNKYTFHLGVLDQGYWPEGIYTAPTDEALRFDIIAIKNMGFNTIRKHIKIEPARWYYHADKLGMLVWQDMVTCAGSDSQSHDEFEKENTENLAQLHNFPSIVIWVLFNEGWNRYDQQKLTEWMKQTDPSRVINGHTGENYDRTAPKDLNDKWVLSDLTDIHDYPGPGIPPYIPGKARVLGEWGGVRVPTLNHQWDEDNGWGYVQTKAVDFARQYQFMIKHLKVYEEEGLSGSIYTEPFDVETEENGLMTYDREIIKIAPEQLRQFNKILLPQAEKYATAPSNFNAQLTDTSDPDRQYALFLQEYKKGKNDSTFLYDLAIMSARVNDKIHSKEIANDYIKKIKAPFNKVNLSFIRQFTTKSTDSTFALFVKYPEKIDSVLGERTAANKLMYIIYIENIAPLVKNNRYEPNWDSLEKELVKKYGNHAEEIVWRSKALHYYNVKNWDRFVIAADPYFKKYSGQVEVFEMNNMAFRVFQNVNDKGLLASALSWSKYTVEKEYSHNNLDTYANLLYKLGRRDEAISFEEKALEVAPKSAKSEIETVLGKMKRGESTWQ